MDRPLRATKHCRHYSYDRGETFLSGGPKCALGIDLSEPRACNPCMPAPIAPCDKRADYTDEERAAWRAYTDHRLQMLGDAIKALGNPVACGESRDVACPHCSGKLTVQRMRNGHAWLQCSTPGCIAPVHFNIGRTVAWPESLK